jgi:hypothetical protein
MHTVFLEKANGLSVDERVGWRTWTRFMWFRDWWWAFVNSHITGRCQNRTTEQQPLQKDFLPHGWLV